MSSNGGDKLGIPAHFSSPLINILLGIKMGHHRDDYLGWLLELPSHFFLHLG
jgi:hypothetical protein